MACSRAGNDRGRLNARNSLRASGLSQPRNGIDWGWESGSVESLPSLPEVTNAWKRV